MSSKLGYLTNLENVKNEEIIAWFDCRRGEGNRHNMGWWRRADGRPESWRTNVLNSDRSSAHVYSRVCAHFIFSYFIWKSVSAQQKYVMRLCFGLVHLFIQGGVEMQPQDIFIFSTSPFPSHFFVVFTHQCDIFWSRGIFSPKLWATLAGWVSSWQMELPVNRGLSSPIKAHNAHLQLSPCHLHIFFHNLFVTNKN